MHILQVCFRVPYPPHDGGAIAMYDVAAGLAEAGHQVTVLAINTPKHHQSDDVLDHLGPNVRLVTVDVDTRLSATKALKNFMLGKLPYIAERFVSDAMSTQLKQIVDAESIDVIQMEGTYVAWYLDIVRQVAPQIPVVLRAHNLENTIWKMLAQGEQNPLKAFYLRSMAGRLDDFERKQLPRFDAIASITEPDKQRFRKIGCKQRIEFIPAGVDLKRFQPNFTVIPKPKTLFMLGSLIWRPNLEAAEWFLGEVWPEVHRQMPELELHLAGKHMPDHLINNCPPQVVMHGFVESAAEFMQQYDLMLVPLLSGGGMRIKIIEGMAMAKCIVSTPVGAEGIEASNGEDIVLRDGAEEWIEAIRQYYCGELGQDEIGAKAQQTIHRLYDNRQIVDQFVQLYQSLGA